MQNLQQTERTAAHNLMIENLITKYKDDSRLGLATKNRCTDYIKFAVQTYKLLEAVDAGTYAHSITFLKA